MPGLIEGLMGLSRLQARGTALSRTSRGPVSRVVPCEVR